jgi:hypothetical protein
LSSQAYAKFKLMGLQNHCDGKQPDLVIKDFRVLLNSTQKATHHTAIYCGTQELIQPESCNKMNISDEQLHTMELCIYHCTMDQVQGLESQCICQMWRCLGSHSW